MHLQLPFPEPALITMLKIWKRSLSHSLSSLGSAIQRCNSSSYMSDTDIDKLSMYHYNQAIDTNLSNLHSILEKEIEYFLQREFPLGYCTPKNAHIRRSYHPVADETSSWSWIGESREQNQVMLA